MKLCKKCLQSKDISCFVKQNKSADGRFTWCKDCQSVYRKIRYNKDLQKSRLINNNNRAEDIRWIQEIKSNTPCIDCHKIYEPYCMDYDHVPEKGKKIKNISRMILDHAPKKSIFEEIAKCDLVCLLCHNKRTYDRLNKKLGTGRSWKQHVQRNINIINTFKNVPCTICNMLYESYNMQIDHIDPKNKLYDICKLKSCKLKTLSDELSKCQVLCALCHRIKSILDQKENKYSKQRNNK